MCQEMNNIIISWKHSFYGKKWFKTNDFLLFLPYSRLNINACGAFIQIHSYQDSKSCFKLVSFYVTLFTLLARARFVLPVLKKYQMIFGIAKLVIFHKLLVAHLEKFASFWLQNWRFRYIFWVSCLVTPCSDGDSKMQQKDNIEKAIISSHNYKP